LNFGYEGREKLFNNFNLEIGNGEKVCIHGNSGNGKSTLIKLIMGYYSIPPNTIFLDYKDISKYDVNSVRSEISYVNQNNKLFNGTIYENIQYGNTVSKKEIDDLVHKFGIQGIYDNLPNGFESDVGVQGADLSGGQKQLIHILRALCKPKKIIILDEPTSAIDPRNKNTVINVINELSKKSTVILITHDESIMRLCNRMIKLDNGRIVEDK
jgi:ABC-type bacteriocin/lantibiotic exporter with double-glycine peptidase domain